MLQPVPRRSLSDAVFQQLQGLILRGDLAAGDALPSERQLCEQLQVNRGAVREALRRLQQSGLISVHQGESTRVLDYRLRGGLQLLPALLLQGHTAERRRAIRSLAEMRAALGPDIARCAAQRHQAQHLDALEGHLHAMDQVSSGDVVLLQRTSMELWTTLVAAADNIAYQLVLNSWREAWDGIQDLVAPALADEVRDLAGYRRLVRAVANRHASRAQREASRLLYAGTQGIDRWVASWE